MLVTNPGGERFDTRVLCLRVTQGDGGLVSFSVNIHER